MQEMSNKEKQKLIKNNLLELSDTTKDIISFDFYQKHYSYPSNMYEIYEIFGITWLDLLENLKINYHSNQKKKKSIEDYLLNKIIEFYITHKRPPHPEDFDENPKYPESYRYNNFFKSWYNAVKLAGLTPYKKQTKTEQKDLENKKEIQEIIKANIRALYKIMNSRFSFAIYKIYYSYPSNYYQIKSTCGCTWTELFDELGIYKKSNKIPEQFKNISNEEATNIIKNNILTLNDKTDGNFSFETYKKYYSYPSTNNIFKEITGTTWTNMLAELKICRDRDNIEYNYSSEYLINKILEFYKINNKVPKAKDLDHDPNYPESKIYVKHFGKWSKALRNAGFEPANKNLTGEFKYKTNEQIKQIIKRNILELNEKTDGLFTFETYKKYYPYPQGKYQVLNLFGCTWNQLVSELDEEISDSKARFKTNKEKRKIIEDNILDLYKIIDGKFSFSIYQEFYSFPENYNGIKEICGCSWKELFDELGL